MQDYQSLNQHLEAVEESIPSVGLVEETEERLMDRISLYQVQCHMSSGVNLLHRANCLAVTKEEAT